MLVVKYIELVNENFLLYYSINNLLVFTVKLAGSPGPTLVCALSCSTYSVSGDNPSTVPISLSNVSLPKLSTTLPSYCIEYFVIRPLGFSGGSHCKVTVVDVTEVTFTEHGTLGSKNVIKL